MRPVVDRMADYIISGPHPDLRQHRKLGVHYGREGCIDCLFEDGLWRPMQGGASRLSGSLA